MIRTRTEQLQVALGFSLALLAGCSNALDVGGVSKNDARLVDGRDDMGHDLCQLNSWYGDGVCDDFCPSPDPDCHGSVADGGAPDGHDSGPTGVDGSIAPDVSPAHDSGPPPQSCGGLAALPCPLGLECVDNPGDGCDPNAGGADCPGICRPKTPLECDFMVGMFCPKGQYCKYDADCDPDTGGNDCPGTCVDDDPGATMACGGVAAIQCPDGRRCIDDPTDHCDPLEGGVDCPGVCTAATTIACGGIAGIQCPAGQVCADDPTDLCDPSTGADCPGVCIAMSCGGIAAIPCPGSLRCIDDPSDTCDPTAGGADCPGICVQ